LELQLLQVLVLKLGLWQVPGLKLQLMQVL